jgi:hypothetical protein
MRRHPRVQYTLVFLEVLVAACALTAGSLMIADPSGGNLGLSPALLDGLPFRTFLVPGIAMIVANVLIPLGVAVGALRGAAWTREWHLIVGLLLTSWLVLQILFIGVHHVIQPMLLALGVAIALLAMQAAGIHLHRRIGRALH